MPKVLVIVPDHIVGTDISEIVSDVSPDSDIFVQNSAGLGPGPFEADKTWDLVIASRFLVDGPGSTIRQSPAWLDSFKILLGSSEMAAETCVCNSRCLSLALPFTDETMRQALSRWIGGTKQPITC